MVNYATVAVKPADPTQSNKIFGGWFKDAACTKAWNFTTDTVTANTTLFAKWLDMPTSIIIKTNPTKTTYTQGQSLDITGAVITANFSDGTKLDILVTSDMVSGYNMNSAGQQTLTITYETQSTTFNITSIPFSITGGNSSITINRSSSTLYGFAAGTTASSLKSMLTTNGGTLHVYNTAGQEVTSGTVGTGATIKLLDSSATVKDQLTAVLHGDTNGDGSISITDLLQVEAVILKKSSLSGANVIAADTNRDGNISITDLLQIESDILGKGRVNQ
jgi:uncharacterized repeat protein (TIGR02543 family)